MDPCIVFGVIISFVVSLLKRIPFVAAYPKIVAAVLSAAVTFFTLAEIGGGSLVIFLGCLAAVFATSVAAHEVIVHPVKHAIFGASKLDADDEPTRHT